MNETIPNTHDINSSSIHRGAPPSPRADVQSDQGHDGSVWSVLLLSLFFLVFAHLSVKDFFPNPVFWVIGAVVIVIAGVAWLVVRKDDLGFLLAIFVCAHFAFADNQGGFWSYVLCAVFFIGTVLGRRQSIYLLSVPRSTSVLMFIFLIHQLLGTVLNPYSLLSNIQATIVALSQVLIFYYCASQQITESNLKRLLSIWFVVACWVFVIGLNQHYHWVIAKSPLLPQMYMQYGKITSIPLGSFGNSELFSEYFCIVFVLSLVIVSHMKELRALHIKRIWPLLMIFISSCAMILGASRAAILLAVVATVYITFFNYFVVPSVRSLKRTFILLPILFLTSLLILTFGSLVSLDEMGKKFKTLNPTKLTIDTVVSGEGINRGSVFAPAYQRLRSGSWWLGYGFNLPENNHESMGFRKTQLGDYHSLYLSLPIYYGWIGATSYVLLIFMAGLRIFILYFRKRKIDHFLIPVALGFAVIWGVFLLDEYKISVTRNHSYFLLTWMWLGLTHSVANLLGRIENTPQKI